ncbi:MAG: hypothetical protein K0Q74_1260, partial [Gammaproteobacteria bacterium]|nr:hypothetical protein [Gammaproteobacteria bacterium]
FLWSEKEFYMNYQWVTSNPLSETTPFNFCRVQRKNQNYIQSLTLS